MATLKDNNCYLAFDSVVVNAYFKEVNLSFTAAEIDITRGAGTDWTEEAAGLLSMSGTAVITYDISDVQTYIQHIAPGQVVPFEYGPESNVSGKPRHVQNIHITSVEQPQNVAKDEVTFSIAFNGSGAPSVNMMAGGVYS